ncbi:YadA-like family protein [Gallibacterium anatis]|uniref:YadA-like family protein n=1 Tax=Gallibacterium anatis TaxID=750 RepID=UPI003003BCA3
MKLNQVAAYYRKRSQLIVLTGILFGGGISLLPLTVNAAVDRAAVLKKVVESGNTDGLTDEEKTWFTSFFSGTTLHSGSEGIKIGAVSVRAGTIGEPQIGDRNKNISTQSNSGIIYGINNDYAGQAYAFGNDNTVLSPGNGVSMGIGYQNRVYGNGSVGIGVFNRTVPTEREQVGMTSAAITVGKNNLANAQSIAMGLDSVAMGELSIALGSRAVAANSLEAATAFADSLYTPGSFHYAEYLQKHFPNKFGAYDASQTEYQRMDKVDPILFNEYKWWFDSVGIASYEKLIEQSGGGAGGEHTANIVMSNFGWKYAMTQNNIMAPVAIGYISKATANYATAVGPGAEATEEAALAGGLLSQAKAKQAVALGRESKALAKDAVAVGYWAKAAAKEGVAVGAWSVASSDYGVALGMESESLPEDVVEVEKAPYSEAKLSVNGNGKTGADNDILRGPVSFGSKLYNKQGVQTATYIRQVQYVADGTHDTDAVNLRQLRGALFNGIKAGDGVTITKQDDPTKPDYGTITVTATNTNTGNATAYSFEAGDNVTVTSEEKDGVTHITISAKDTTYTPGENVTIDNGNISATDTKYTAGDNITIDKDGKISAKDTTYTAGENITIDDNNKISAAKYEAGDNVSIKKKEGADNTFVISATNSGGTDFNVKGDVGEATQVKSGDTVNITGGATGLSHNANIGVEKADDGLKLRLAKDITTESVTLSKGENGKSTKMDAESVTVNNGKQSTKVSAESVSVNNGSQHTTVNAGGISVNNNNQAPVSLTSRGLDNGGNRISNVADGVQPHDAVNVSQLNRVKKKMEKHSDAGTAAAIAVGNLPHAMHSGKSMVAVAGGSYGGESAVAIGVSHTNEKGNVILKLSGTSDSNGKYGVGAGVGYEF